MVFQFFLGDYFMEYLIMEIPTIGNNTISLNFNLMNNFHLNGIEWP